MTDCILQVYACYAYEGEMEDELDVREGEELTVKSKETGEKHWWMCENGKTGGIVPRNYLSLYPPLKYRNE